MKVLSWFSGMITQSAMLAISNPLTAGGRSLLVSEGNKWAELWWTHGMNRRGPDMRKWKGSRSMRGDCQAGIEGLPLQLLIMVVVAGLGLTIIMGWMNSISAPHSIGEVFVNPSEISVYDKDGDGLYTNDHVMITVTVTDQSGDRLEGATVVLEGANVEAHGGGQARGVTDSSGLVVLSDLKVEQFGSKLTTIVVTIAKGDYGVDSSYQIPVIPS